MLYQKTLSKALLHNTGSISFIIPIIIKNDVLCSLFFTGIKKAGENNYPSFCFDIRVFYEKLFSLNV